jgi:hypothetical protein
VSLVTQKKKNISEFVRRAFQALGHGTAHVVSRHSLTTEAQVQSQASPVRMGFVVNIVEQTGFSPSTVFYSWQYNSVSTANTTDAV